MGTGDTTGTNHTPRPLISVTHSPWASEKWKDIVSGQYHACGIRLGDGSLRCWGYGIFGKLGTGEEANRIVPTPLVAGWDETEWKMVSLGVDHTCGIRADDDRIFCWGFGGDGRLGNAATSQQLVPTALTMAAGWNTTAWKSLTLGSIHTCGIRSSDDRIFCWGRGSDGRLGTGDTTTTNTIPRSLTATAGWDMTAWKSVSAGNLHTCAIRASDNRIFCWGLGSSGQLGTGDTTATNHTPRPLTSANGWDMTAWKSVSAGNNFTCAVRLSDNRVFCWGSGADGRLGTGDILDRNVPTALASANGWNTTAWKSVHTGAGDIFSVSGRHACAIRLNDNRLFCWGDGSGGQLGTGDTNATNHTPRPLTSTDDWNRSGWKTVSIGGYHTLGVQADPRECPVLSSNYDDGDFVLQLLAAAGKTKVGRRGSFLSGGEGFLAYDSADGAVKVCVDGAWKSLITYVGASCSSYPAGVGINDRVIEWKKDGDGKTFNSRRSLRPTPREGSMTYNSVSKTLQVCDGIDWLQISTPP